MSTETDVRITNRIPSSGLLKLLPRYFDAVLLSKESQKDMDKPISEPKTINEIKSNNKAESKNDSVKVEEFVNETKTTDASKANLNGNISTGTMNFGDQSNDIGNSKPILNMICNTIERFGYITKIIPTVKRPGLYNVLVFDQQGNWLDKSSLLVDADGIIFDKRPKWFPVIEHPSIDISNLEFIYPAFAITNHKGEYNADDNISNYISLRYTGDGLKYNRLYNDNQINSFKIFNYHSFINYCMNIGDNVAITKKILKILSNKDILEEIYKIQEHPMFCVERINSRDKFSIVSNSNAVGKNIRISYDNDQQPNNVSFNTF